LLLKQKQEKKKKKPYANFKDNHSPEEYIDFLTSCDNNKFYLNHSLPIAIATTAYARIFMFKVIYRLIED